MKWWPRLAILAFAFLLVDLVWLAQLDRGGVPHVRLDLEGGIPATFYVPRPASGEIPPFGLPEPPPPGQRPPALVLVHGFSEDRVMMSPLARSLAEAGYAVLAIDVRGHGENRNSLGRGIGDDSGLVADIGAAVDFLRTSPYVDGMRISVGGHSMGAGASVSYGGRDSGIDALLLISGGWRVEGPETPRNVLFLYAENDPASLAEGVRDLARQLSGDDALEVGETRGDLAQGTGVRLAMVPGTDHVGIITSHSTVFQSVAWLDEIYGIERSRPAQLVDARIPAQRLGSLALLLLLPGLGIAAGRLAPRVAQAPAPRNGQRLLLFAAAMFFSLPLVAVEGPGEFLPLAVADVLVLQLFYVGAALLGWLAFSGRLALVARTGRPIMAVLAALVGFVALYALLTPLNVTLHRLALGPERALVGLVSAVLLLPFCFASGLLLRQGSTWRASLSSLAGHAILIGALVCGVLFEITPFVVMLMLPMFALLLVCFELVATGIYAASRNIAAIAIFEALFIAWIFAAVLPLVS